MEIPYFAHNIQDRISAQKKKKKKKKRKRFWNTNAHMKHAFFFYECDKYFTFTNMCEKDATKKKSGHVMLPKKN